MSCATSCYIYSPLSALHWLFTLPMTMNNLFPITLVINHSPWPSNSPDPRNRSPWPLITYLPYYKLPIPPPCLGNPPIAPMQISTTAISLPNSVTHPSYKPHSPIFTTTPPSLSCPTTNLCSVHYLAYSMTLPFYISFPIPLYSSPSLTTPLYL